MKLQSSVLPAAFLGLSLPVVVLLGALDFGGEFRLLIAVAAGGAATALAQSLLAKAAATAKKEQP